MNARARALRKRCKRMLSELDLPEVFDLELLLTRLAQRRGRPLRLLPLLPGLRDEPSGMWVPLPEEDVIFAESSVSGWYRDHVVFHEVGHVLWAHTGSVRDVAGWLGQYGVTSPARTRVALRCSVSAVEQEREAEMVALLLESSISQEPVSAAPASASTPAEVAAVLNRLAAALGGPSGRD